MEELTSITRKWDKDFLERLYDEYYKALRYYALKILNDEREADDVVQEIFARLWEKRPTFETKHALRSYLYTCTYNLAIDERRKSNTTLRDTMPLTEENIEGDFDYNEGMLQKERIYINLFEAIDNLSPQQRRIFLMTMEGKKIRDIADTLGISMNTVKVQKQRGMKVLREKLSQEEMVILLLIIGGAY